MTSLYTWLLFTHLTALAVFLLGHGVSAAAAFVVRNLGSNSRLVLRISTQSWFVAGPAFLILLASGVWMGFLGSWWRHGWIWTAITILVLLGVLMSWLSRPFYLARESKTDEELTKSLTTVRPLAMTWIGTIGLVAILFLMVFKPF